VVPPFPLLQSHEPSKFPSAFPPDFFPLWISNPHSYLKTGGSSGCLSPDAYPPGPRIGLYVFPFSPPVFLASWLLPLFLLFKGPGRSLPPMTALPFLFNRAASFFVVLAPSSLLSLACRPSRSCQGTAIDSAFVGAYFALGHGQVPSAFFFGNEAFFPALCCSSSSI